jgi:carboxypeptidase PM20D1
MGKKLTRVLAGIFAVIFIIIAIMLIKTVSFTSKQVKAGPAGDFAVDAQSASQRLSEAIKIPTISYENYANFQGAELLRFHIYLEKSFPQVHKSLKKEVINKYSLLYTWPGRDLKLKPIVFMAHMDVVPVEEKTMNEWKYKPFDGSIAEGYIWGRGSLDNKSNLMGIMEAVEGLLAKGFQPQQTIYIVSGHDEELGGRQGAVKIAELFQSRGLVIDYVIDEGMVITDGIIPGVAARVGLVGIAEKGFISVELQAKGGGGHSSMPPRETTVGILCKAVAKLENNPFPARLDGPAKYLFDYAGREMSFVNKMIMANLWLTESLLKGQLQKSNATNAMIRTTTAPTMLEGSNKDNVMPNVARAVVNFRILPGDTPESVLEYVRKTVNDPRVEIKPASKEIQSPSPVAGIDSKSFLAIQKSIRQIFPDVIVAPSLAIVASDSRHFAGLTRDIYKFAPMVLKASDTGRLHGIDERIAVDNYTQLIKFYMQLIINSQT